MKMEVSQGCWLVGWLVGVCVLWYPSMDNGTGRTSIGRFDSFMSGTATEIGSRTFDLPLYDTMYMYYNGIHIHRVYDDYIERADRNHRRRLLSLVQRANTPHHYV